MAWITFFTSFSTLICCALPSLLVSLGAASTLIALFTHLPWLVTISENKEITWLTAGILLILNGIWRRRATSCPIDPELAKKCTQVKKVNTYLWWGSLLIYLVGVGWGLAGELLF